MDSASNVTTLALRSTEHMVAADRTPNMMSQIVPPKAATAKATTAAGTSGDGGGTGDGWGGWSNAAWQSWWSDDQWHATAWSQGGM